MRSRRSAIAGHECWCPRLSEITLNPDVVCSPLPEGGVLLDLDTKQYFALNRTGMTVWQHLEDGGSLAGLRASLGEAAAGDLDAFAACLIGHGLATQAPAREPGAVPTAPPAQGPWDAPTVTPHGRPLAQVILSPFDPTVPIPE